MARNVGIGLANSFVTVKAQQDAGPRCLDSLKMNPTFSHGALIEWVGAQISVHVSGRIRDHLRRENHRI
jgi:hypothetical protein